MARLNWRVNFTELSIHVAGSIDWFSSQWTLKYSNLQGERSTWNFITPIFPDKSTSVSVTSWPAMSLKSNTIAARNFVSLPVEKKLFIVINLFIHSESVDFASASPFTPIRLRIKPNNEIHDRAYAANVISNCTEHRSQRMYLTLFNYELDVSMENWKLRAR